MLCKPKIWFGYANMTCGKDSSQFPTQTYELQKLAYISHDLCIDGNQEFTIGA